MVYARYCTACGGRRKHSREVVSVGCWCKRCRKSGRWEACYCMNCGKRGCVDHDDPGVIERRLKHPEDFPDPPLQEIIDALHAEQCDEEDFDESVHSCEKYYRELAPYDEGHPEDRSRVSSRSTRHQCDICKKWFDFEDELEDHQDENDYGMGCRKCQECFPESGIYNHALDNKHDRCFVEGCRDKYARVSGWTDREVEEHVYESHSKRHKPSMQPQRVRFSNGAQMMGASVRNRR